MRPESRKRNNFTMRLRDELRAAIEQRANANSRSLSEEVETLLEQLYGGEAMLDGAWELAYGRQGRDLMKLIGHIIKRAPIGPDWLNDPTEYGLTIAEIVAALTQPPLAPEGTDVAAHKRHGEAQARQRLRSALTEASPIQRNFDPAARARIARWLTDYEAKRKDR